MYFPKVLIFGPPFNNYTGGGITLTNLFKAWPIDKIAVASTGHVLQNLTTDVCNKFYQLGEEEHRWRFPFNLIQRSFPSGLLSFNKQETLSQSPHKTNIRQFLVDRLFYPFVTWLGLFHYLSKISLSQSFKKWLSEYQPEVLYIQVSSREEILFSIELCDYLGIPSVIHIMDDWPSTIGKKGLFKNYWRKKIDKEFRQLLYRMNLCLSISDAMTSEYLNRYDKVFKAFHNPIEIEAWQPYCKTNFELDYDHVKILYSGRIGIGITESLIEVANVIDNLNDSLGNIKLYIQTATNSSPIIHRLEKFKCIVINPIVNYSDLPVIFSQADILIIANDFDKQGIDFLKYSMPTKVSEYMISGTPVLVYSHFETAVSRFFTDNDCGCCVTEQIPEKLSNAIKLMVSDEAYRKKISHNAVRLATELFDSKKVRTEFQQLLINLPK
jgi:glycosyltransferase involved in cell wall biosynthesis